MPHFNIFCDRLKGSLKKNIYSLFRHCHLRRLISRASFIPIKTHFVAPSFSWSSNIPFLSVTKIQYFFRVQFSHTIVFPQYCNVCLS